MGLVRPRDGFLAFLREITEAHGTLLVFDEVMVGFRVAPGGAQALTGVTPDVTILGKVIGGGLPVGAYGGRADVMKLMAPEGPVYQAGTLSGNPLAMAAGLALLRELDTTDAWQRASDAARDTAAAIQRAADAAGVPVVDRRRRGHVRLLPRRRARARLRQRRGERHERVWSPARVAPRARRLPPASRLRGVLHVQRPHARDRRAGRRCVCKRLRRSLMSTPRIEAPAVPKHLLGVLFLGTFLAALDIAIVGPALPTLRDAFGVNEREVAWTFTAFVLANLAGLPVMAALSDRIGRRAVYLADIAIFALGTLVVALAPSFGVLLAGRVVQGIGASGIFPVASAVIGDVYPPERRGRAVGLLGSVFGVAFLVGPAVGGIVLSLASWRWLFALSLPLALLVFGLSARTLPRQERRAEAPPFDALGTVTLVALLVALVVGLAELDAAAPFAGLLRPESGGVLGLAAALAGMLVVVERRAAAPLIRPGLVARRPVQVACALAVGAGMVEATFVLLSAYTVAAYGVEASRASYLLLPLVGGVALGSPVSGRFLDRVGPRPVVTAAAVLVTLGLTGVAAAPGLGLHVAATVVLGLGLSGILGSSLSYILLSEAGAGERTVAQGLSTVFLSIGQLAGAAALTALAASASTAEDGYRLGFTAVAVVALVLVGVARALPSAPRGGGAREDATG